jgi:DNA-binding MarR family transcriptional regulator
VNESDSGEPAPRAGLLRLIILVAHLLEQRCNDALSDLDITTRQALVLELLARDPGNSRAGLARLLGISPQAVGGLTRRLCDAGLVAGAATSSGERARYTLTSMASELLDSAQPEVSAVETQVLESLGDKASAVVDGLEQLLTELRTLPESPSHPRPDLCRMRA